MNITYSILLKVNSTIFLLRSACFELPSPPLSCPWLPMGIQGLNLRMLLMKEISEISEGADDPSPPAALVGTHHSESYN